MGYQQGDLCSKPSDRTIPAFFLPEFRQLAGKDQFRLCLKSLIADLREAITLAPWLQPGDPGTLISRV